MLEEVASPGKVKEFTAQDKTRMFYREWEGEGALILYLHGLESHSGWFVDTGNLLNQNGFHVYALDRRGSGMSETERGHIENYEILINDVKEIITLAKTSHPKKKIYVVGLCWGAKIAVTFTAQYQDMIDGLILLGPAIKTKANLSLREKIDVAMSNLFSPHKLFDVPLNDSMFTKDPKYLEFIKHDKLKLKKATARFFFETGKLNRRLDKIAPLIYIPVLALLAENDVIVDNEGVKVWFAKVGSKDKTIKTYPGCCHSLEFEKQRYAVIDHITHWIKSHK